MNPWLIVEGDWIESLRKLPDNSVHCVVTSPPYWGLRDYGVAGQLGLERTPEEYLAKIVEGFREVRRVLRKDGTCWVNMGDSYSSRPNGTVGATQLEGSTSPHAQYRLANGMRKTAMQWKHKDLVGMPWRLAFALQADGWYLRQDIIWAKPNPMPESVRDRCTKAHEYIFLLSKSAKYFYDATAIEEPVSGNAHGRGDGVNPKAKATGRNSRQCVDRDPTHLASKNPKQNESFSGAVNELVSSRNKRSVWEVATAPYTEAHFATFPPKLIEPCIMAGTSEKGCCPECGAPWKRILKPSEAYAKHLGAGKRVNGYEYDKDATDGMKINQKVNAEYVTVGWHATCAHGDLEPIASTVLDPFSGAGTTGMVARRLQRNYIGLELNPQYIEMSADRIIDDQPLFNLVPQRPAEVISE